MSTFNRALQLFIPCINFPPWLDEEEKKRRQKLAQNELNLEQLRHLRPGTGVTASDVQPDVRFISFRKMTGISCSWKTSMRATYRTSSTITTIASRSPQRKAVDMSITYDTCLYSLICFTSVMCKNKLAHL